MLQLTEEMLMSRLSTQIGPTDHGRRMSLDEFDLADGREGYVYELGRGVVVVTNVPGRKHQAQVSAIRLQLSAYQLAHPDRVHIIAAGSECKVLLADAESERHPDIAVYRSPPLHEEDLWSTWVPNLVIEVVSSGSGHRDYVEKREEYFQFGVSEYWIVDAAKREMLVLRRMGGRWVEQVVGQHGVYEPKLLSGLRFEFAKVLAAADAVPTPD
jgi:Uma2 family endonuclease